MMINSEKINTELLKAFEGLYLVNNFYYKSNKITELNCGDEWFEVMFPELEQEIYNDYPSSNKLSSIIKNDTQEYLFLKYIKEDCNRRNLNDDCFDKMKYHYDFEDEENDNNIFSDDE